MAELKKCEVCKKDFKNLTVHMKKHSGKGAGVALQSVDSGANKPAEVNPIENKMDQMISGLNSVAGALGKLIEIQSQKPDKSPTEVSPDKMKTHFNPKLDDETYPSDYVPPKFRKICDEILSAEFGLQIVDFTDRTDFQINITVPEKYSSVTNEDKIKGVKDIRSRMVPRALGENGVREWCTLIRKNLNKFYTKEGVQSPFNNTI